jgi:hypothetical protein
MVVASGADLAVRTASPGRRAATLASAGAVALVVGGVLAMSRVGGRTGAELGTGMVDLLAL